MINLTSSTRGTLFALVAACGLGSITTQAKIVYADGGNALTLMLIRLLMSTLLFGILLWFRREGIGVAKAQRLPLLALGLIWTGGMICYLSSVETISVSLAVLIFYTYPLLVLGWSIIRRQLIVSVALIGLFICAFAGLYLALSGGEIRLNPGGIMFAGLASVSAAFTFICGARVATRISPLLMTFWINAAGLIMILPLMIDQLAWPGALPGVFALTAATVFYLIAILSQFEALARLPAAQAAFILNLEPVVSILMALLVLGEILSITQWSGVVLVLTVIILSIRFKPSIA